MICLIDLIDMQKQRIKKILIKLINYSTGESTNNDYNLLGFNKMSKIISKIIWTIKAKKCN